MLVGDVAAAVGRLGLAGRGVLVAVSGGLDSTALLHALHLLSERHGLNLSIGHVNHGLRGDESEADETAVCALGADLGRPVRVARVDPAALREGLASRERPTLQEAARSLRYRALAELAEQTGASRIATAHNADDQAETVLLRLMRGTSPDGLGGIPERSPDGRIVRPLLRVSREQIEGFAREQRLRWREDSSNRSVEYTRNRLRRHWLPGLAGDFNPRLLRAIGGLAETQREDSEWIATVVEREAASRFATDGRWLQIEAKDWSEMPDALARRLARWALVHCGEGRAVSRVHLERMLSFRAGYGWSATTPAFAWGRSHANLHSRDGSSESISPAESRSGLRAKLFELRRILAAQQSRPLERPVNQQFYRNMALWVVILVMILLLATMLRQGQTTPPDIAFSEFHAKIDLGEIESVTIEEGHVTGRYTTGSEFQTYVPAVTEELISKLQAQNVEIVARPKPEGGFWRQLLIMWFPLVLIIGIWIFFIRQMQAGGGKAMSFGKSRARLLTENQQQVTFEDVAGIEESKTELEEIIAFLQEPKKFTRLGGRIPKGVLLVGPPGTGKTLLARAVAGEAEVPFYSISGSDFVEMFVGVGASRVRDLFSQGKKNAPCIIFIDEIDAVGRHRGAGLGGGHDEREQTLNQLLVEMDGFESNEGVILIAATNRPDVLDPALLRPGRFDRRVVVPRPDLRGRIAILEVHTRRVPLDEDVDLQVIARGTPGFVGADLQNLVNEAALLAARRDAGHVCMVDFEEAKDKVLIGTPRRSLIMSEEDKRQTAYHEAGHALVAMLSPEADPVHKVTIIPRGMALGVTLTLPEQDRYSMTREQIVAHIKHAMGGRAAEEIVFAQFSTGAANDLKQATDQARRMVCSYGMSEKIGPVSLADDEHDVFLGRDFVSRKEYSERTANQIDEEIGNLLRTLYAEAKEILIDHRDVLDRISEALLERETLDNTELQLLMDGEPLPPIAMLVPAAKEPPAERSPERTKAFPGDELPDPEPVPG